ncbi:MAG: HAMP domain-containing protein [Geobacteraceae bacterium]|nr:HAMP domain-containing protein [Geobacteraceae bacterium]NTW81140.1 HAMP domain-containing protein [Geobacteraceae bacterium]
MQRVRTPIRRKLIFATLTPLCVAILLCWLIGSLLITDRIYRQAQQKVIGDLNLARKVYQDEINHLSSIVRVAGLMPSMMDHLTSRRPSLPKKALQQLLHEEQLSFLNVIDSRGVVQYRSAHPTRYGDRLDGDPLVARALKGDLSGGAQIYSRERLTTENPELAEKALTAIKPTPRARAVSNESEQRGLMLVAVAPLLMPDGRVAGVLQAGFMLNGDSRVVDTITRIVFEREGGGAATVFLGDVRIATNVRDPAGGRATGTLMSVEVARDVLSQGKLWSDRAFVLSNWYISAYEPIRDPSGSVIGALYVGMPEQPLLDLRKNLNLIFAGVLLFVALIGITLSTWIGSRLAQPVRALAEAARRLASGELVGPILVRSDDEIGLLADEFNTMTREVSTLNQTLEQKVLKRTRQLEEKSQQLLDAQKELAKSERLAGLGLLAAGVAHEINNPLAVIRGNAELLQISIPKESEDREEVDAIVEEAIRIGRIVKNLGAFSRGGMQRVSHFSLGGLLDGILDQIGHQISLKRYRIARSYWGKDVTMEGDEDQLRQVFTNLIVNGLQAMPEGGELVVDALPDGRDGWICVTVCDHGIGIRAEDMGRLFTPFFSTKQQGTGLGLAVSYGIVSDHGGEIKVNSSVGSGAAFTVLLPINQIMRVSGTTTDSHPESQTGNFDKLI